MGSQEISGFASAVEQRAEAAGHERPERHEGGTGAEEQRGRRRVVVRWGERGQPLECDTGLQGVPVVEGKTGSSEQETLGLDAVVGEEMGESEPDEVDLVPVGGPGSPTVPDAFSRRVERAG